jgi:signal transduction histidine kinase
MLALAVVFPFFTAVAVMRHHALNAKPAAVKAVTSAALLVSLIVAYVVSVNALQALFGLLNLDALFLELPGERLNWMVVSNVLATVVTAVLYVPLRDRIHQGVTRLLYPYRIPVDEALNQLHRAVRQADQSADSDAETAIPRVATETLRDMLRLQDVFLWFYFPASGDLQLVGRTDVQPTRVSLDSGAVHALVQATPLVGLPTEPALEPLSVALADLHVQMCLPLVYGGRELVGLVGLGARRDEVPFSPEDCQLVSHLGEYLLLLLKNERTVRALEQSRERISRAQETERKRIARELHDQTRQDLSYLATVQLERCRRAVSDPQETARLIEETQEQIGRISAALRSVLSDISPEIVSRRGLASALESLVSNARRRLEEQDVEITLHIAGYTDQILPEQYELAVFRTVQEALRNALRHAQASKVEVRLECADGCLQMVVEDDGEGFDTGQLDTALCDGHLGLQNMRDRIETLGGRFVVGSTPRRGTSVQAVIPLPRGDQS